MAEQVPDARANLQNLRNAQAEVQNSQNEWAIAFIEDDHNPESPSNIRFLDAEEALMDSLTAESTIYENLLRTVDRQVVLPRMSDDWAATAFANAYAEINPQQLTHAVNLRVMEVINSVRRDEERRRLRPPPRGPIRSHATQISAELAPDELDNNGRGGRRRKSRRKTRRSKINKRYNQSSRRRR